MTNLNLHDIPGGELCRLCGLTFYARSMGGPGVCPSCDCGFSGPVVVERQAKEIGRLRDQLAAMCGWAETLAEKQGWERWNANSFWTSSDAARSALGRAPDEPKGALP